MPEDQTKLTDMKVDEWSSAVGTITLGAAMLIIAALAFYFVGFALKAQYLAFARSLLVGAMVVGVVLVGAALYQVYRVGKLAHVPFLCPYCHSENLFLERPVSDFECENCQRTVHFLNGEPAPVRTVVCQHCGAEHRVGISVSRYVCDRCNRPLRIEAEGDEGVDIPPEPEAEAQRFDVLIVSADTRRMSDLTAAVQSILTISMSQARRQIDSVSATSPFPVLTNVPRLKAEAVKRHLEELGAKVVIASSLRENSST